MSKDKDKDKGGEPKAKKRGVGDAAVEAIRAGKTNDEALAIVKGEFPDAKTSLASINWYRNKERATDKSVPTMRELNKKNKTADDKTAPDPLD